MPYNSWIEREAREKGISIADLEEQINVIPLYIRFTPKSNSLKDDNFINEMIAMFDFVTDLSITIDRVVLGFGNAKLLQGTGILYTQDSAYKN